MTEWNVGDRVQTDKNGTLRVGVVTAVEKVEEEKTRYNYSYSYGSNSRQETYREVVVKSLDVKWDDGEEQKGLGKYDVYAEDSEMERAFRLAIPDANRRIREKLAEADAALDEAVRISEETGIPFSAGISPLSQSYIPGSLTDKFPGVERDFYSDLTDAYGEYEGWQHSAVC